MKQISSNQLLNLMVDVKVVLGSTKRRTQDLVQLKEGSILELDQLAGEAVDIEANGLVVAHGEVVVIDENFGVRITEIVE